MEQMRRERGKLNASELIPICANIFLNCKLLNIMLNDCTVLWKKLAPGKKSLLPEVPNKHHESNSAVRI
jgi:hypothetical protein